MISMDICSAELISTSGKPLSELVGARIEKFPASGEINRQVEDAEKTLASLLDRYGGEAISVDSIDGHSFEFENWRFNIRMSNTEPVVRLNVESRQDVKLMQEKTEEILQFMERSA
jgi:phosphomannomutase